jgi:hypothetical protein
LVRPKKHLILNLQLLLYCEEGTVTSCAGVYHDLIPVATVKIIREISSQSSKYQSTSWLCFPEEQSRKDKWRSTIQGNNNMLGFVYEIKTEKYVTVMQIIELEVLIWNLFF